MNAKKYRASNLDNESFISDSTSSDDIASSDDIETNNKEPKPKSDELSEHKRKWNPIWKVTYPWLRLGQKGNSPALFCKLCEAAKFHNNFVAGCEYLKEQSIKRHIKTKDHQKLIQAREESQMSLEKGFTQQLEASYLSVIRNLMNTYWLAKNLIATSKITDLTSLTEYHIKCNIAEEYTSEETYILNHPLLESLEESRADYGSYSNAYAAREFIDAIGRVIEEAICQEIRESPIWSIMIDESNTITTTKNLAIVSKYISKNLPIEDAASEIPYLVNYNDIVRSLYNYFSNSYLRMEHLKMVEAQLEDPELHLLKIVTTRWLSLSNVVSNLHRIINSIIQALQDDYTKSKTAQMLFNMIDQNFLLTTHFLADILRDLRHLTLIFQANYVSLYEVKIQINATIQKIRFDFLGNNDQEPTWRNFLRQFLDENNLSTDDIPLHIQEFAQATIENLQIRFPDHEITDAFCIFDPRNLPTTFLNEYGNKEITTIANYYGTSKSVQDIIYSPFIDKDNLIQEWKYIRILLVNFSSLKPNDAWLKLFNTPNFSILYPNIVKIVSIFLTLPLSNAFTER
ncbi:10497_t:CDS:2, partial [Gigaspora rosea]